MNHIKSRLLSNLHNCFNKQDISLLQDQRKNQLGM